MTNGTKDQLSRLGVSQQDYEWRNFVEKIQVGTNVSFEEQWDEFQQIFVNRKETEGPPLVWLPGQKQFDDSNLGRFMKELNVKTYDEIHRWSVKNRENFWRKVIERLGFRFAKDPTTILDLSNGVKNPTWLADAKMNIVESCFLATSDKAAIISGKESSSDLSVTSYGELEEMVNRISNGLCEHDFKTGDRIALYMPMTEDCVAAYLGIIQAGCVVVSIADSFSAVEIKKRMKIAGAQAIITVDSYSRAGRRIQLYQKVIEAGVEKAIVILSEKSDVVLRNSDFSWQEFLSTKNLFEPVVGNPDQVTNILFSSGTTGTPKAVPWSHLTPIKCGMDGHFHQDIHSEDVVTWPTNIGWMMGPWLIYATFLNNATMALYESAPVGQDFFDFVQNSDVTVLGVIPSLVRVWRNSGLLGDDKWCKIRIISSTGEPSSREDYLWLMSRTKYKAPVIEYLGGTEIGGGHITGSVVQPASPATFTTPALGIDFVLQNSGGEPVKENEMGELFLIPPAIGLSQTLLNKNHEEVYYKNCPPGPNGEILRRHGDQFVKLANGFYKTGGRADDAMNLGGIKISSIELEKVVEEHLAVFECAAIAVQPEGEGQEKLVIFVVLKKKSDLESLKKEVGAMIAKKLNPLFKLYDLVEIKDLPRTASNKLMRRKLRSSYLEKR